jgi:phosphotransferase system HPr-like phosphotransfer protein
MQCAYTVDGEEILKFKTSRGFKMQVACKTTNNEQAISKLLIYIKKK